ncbi:GntR family transcriptional regulator [bacterium D16-51]|nr:GntR family transcriptional regulator [bacterium D16-59]RKI52588.1 GntR family transcriptional regulator [bacterium D16-51]
MEWKFTDDAPIYQQIMDMLKQEIASGELAAGQKLPSVRELALEAGVNPNTMQKALAELEREGLLYSQRTAGRFVADQKEIRDGLQEELMMEYIEVFLKKMKKLGYSIDEVIVLLQKFEQKGED